METQAVQQQIADLAALQEPTRRALYFHVVENSQETSRNQAARALGVSPNLAGFHLDRLVEGGLLEVSYRRLSGRTGPGAGRPAKLYRRAQRQIHISLPQREYELAAKILAASVSANQTPAMAEALATAAGTFGRQIGAGVHTGAAILPADDVGAMEAVITTLRECGYEPVREHGEIRLRNCPFHNLVQQNRELVCGMNLALIEGLLGGIGLDTARAVLEPHANRCCVCLKPQA